MTIDDRTVTDRPLRVHGRQLAQLRRVREAVDQAPSFDAAALPARQIFHPDACTGAIDDAGTRPAPAGSTGPGESAPLATVTDHHLDELMAEATAAHLDGETLQLDALEVMSLVAALQRERVAHHDHLLGLGDILGRHAARAVLPPRDGLVEVLRTQIPGLTLTRARRVAGEITRAGIRGDR